MVGRTGAPPTSRTRSSSQFLDGVLSQGGPQALPYHDDEKWSVLQHLLYVIQKFPGLKGKTAVFTHNDGRTSNLLQAAGTIPMYFQDVKYNTPITMWLLETYPRQPPLVFVTPTREMIIKPRHPYVDASGMVNSLYIQYWVYPRSNLVELVQSLSFLFGQDPPLYSRPAAPVNARPPPFIHRRGRSEGDINKLVQERSNEMESTFNTQGEGEPVEVDRYETSSNDSEVESYVQGEGEPVEVDRYETSSNDSEVEGEGEPVEVDRAETPRNSSEVEGLQARASLNSSDEIQDEHGGQSKLEAELQVINMVFADIPLDFRATRFEVIMECLIASVQGVEAQVAEFLRLHSGKHIQVFNHECNSLVDTLSGTIHDRLRRYNNTLSLVQVAGVNDRGRIFMSVAFCIAALSELERMFKTVVNLLTSCSKEDWWNTALELSNALPSPTIPRWSSFSLAIRSCEWSMDIVDFGFHALEQFLAGASTVSGVVFKWSDKQSRMVLHIHGKPLYHDEGGSSLLDVTRDLEGKDVTALIQKLVDLNETPRKWFSRFPRFSGFLGNEDTNMQIIADFLSQKLHGQRPEPNAVPYTFQVDLSTLKYVKHIGSGSFGSVAEFKWLGHKVSVKVVKSPGLSRKQFEMESAILATVQHPRVVRMIGRAFEGNEGMGSLVMELMEGDLRHVIEKRFPDPARGVSPFPLVVAIDIMLQIGEGMQYLREHRILHRDLKAKNVLLNRCRTSECGAYGKFPALASLLHTEEYYIVKLADFGIAKARREQTNFGTMMVGTSSWRAPEVYKVTDVGTAQNYEWPADVYSFAMTCYEILTGCIPFDTVPNSELYKRIVDGERPPLDGVRLPPLLKDLVERCWKTDPNERPNFDEICKTLWQCKVEIILPAFELQVGHSETESVAVKACGECSHA